jgi:hypothetical protein
MSPPQFQIETAFGPGMSFMHYDWTFILGVLSGRGISGALLLATSSRSPV